MISISIDMNGFMMNDSIKYCYIYNTDYKDDMYLQLQHRHK